MCVCRHFVTGLIPVWSLRWKGRLMATSVRSDPPRHTHTHIHTVFIGVISSFFYPAVSLFSSWLQASLHRDHRGKSWQFAVNIIRMWQVSLWYPKLTSCLYHIQQRQWRREVLFHKTAPPSYKVCLCLSTIEFPLTVYLHWIIIKMAKCEVVFF